ncbi:Insulin-like receptor [Eumeta japonica]|uniref:Tyrosine-protein kinase receptor n=1 Tax=Eumeta variegata TaxID=151549 RepID=A0A4C1VF57_EUMVA|nr:Insulin-like receptor [Eumeta japonica]
MVTDDKNWIYCYDPATKRQFAQWLFPFEKLPTINQRIYTSIGRPRPGTPKSGGATGAASGAVILFCFLRPLAQLFRLRMWDLFFISSVLGYGAVYRGPHVCASTPRPAPTRYSNYDTRLCPLCPGEGSGGSRQSSCPVDFDGRPLCWDDKHCQKQCPRDCREGACMDNGTCCHESCVGGCSSPRAQDCFVCRHFAFGYGSNRKCLEKCPAHTYQHFGRRCVTETECRSMPPPIIIDSMNVNAERPDTRVNRTYKTLNDTCVYACPAGYEEIGEDDRNTTCLKCPPEGCTRPCLPGKVESLDSAELFRGCTHIQGSLEINIRGGGIVMSELESCLGEVRVIDGALKVTRSYALVSLGFFKKLRKIGGQTPNGTKKQSLFIFDNPNLEQLWNWETHGPIEITEGKLFIHFNPKLCYSEILPLKNMTRDSASIFDELEVSKENNGDKAACFRETLHLNVSQLDKNYVLLSWSQYCLEDARKLLGYSIYFTKAENNITQYERRDACSDTWSVDDMSMDEVQNNVTISSVFMNNCNRMQPLFHPLTRLSPYTRYAAYVKTYTTLQENRGAQSPIIYFTTLPGQPSPPMFSQQSHVDSHTVVLKWARPVLPNGSLIMYQVLVQRDNHHEEQILQLNYCGNRNSTREGNNLMIKQIIVIVTASAFATFIAQRKDESPKKKSDKEMYAGQVRDDTCRCDSPARPTTRFTPDREAEQLEAIEFENQLQNQIYVRTKSKSTYPTTTTTKTRRSIDNQMQQMISEIKNNTRPSHNVVYNNITDEAGFVDVYYAEVNANTTTIKLENLRHYSWYTVTLRACRAKHPKESQFEFDTFRCSEKASKTIMTWERADADVVTNVRADLLPANKSTPEVNVTWDPPKQPNGIVVAYNIRHSRVENDNPKAALHSCLTRDDYVSNGHAYILRNLAPGNYSIAVSAVTLRGAGNFSAEAYINVPERSDYNSNWIWGLIVGCILLLCVLAIGIWYARRGFLPPTEANKLFASVNPEYVSTVYVPDEWEVARTSIELVRELGQGTFGMVYEGIARNIKGSPEIRCAVKTVNEHATDRERIEFLNEASVMKAFDTFHVVRLLGVVSRGQPTLVVMELMEQGDLKSYLRSHRPDADSLHPERHPPTLQQIQQMAIEIADGMAYLSAKKFVHRDLAARNCMVAGDLTVKVGDFGMTRDIYETDYYRKGTKGLLPVRWMSPESLKDGVFSSNSDVWSYGVVLWEMATLAMQPYQGLSNEQVLRYVTEGGVMERPEQCPDRLYELMRACWAHRPSARPSFLHLVASLAPSAAPHFRQRSFFHTPHGQELYAQQQNVQEEEPEGTEVNVGAVATGSGSNLFGVSGRLASWVRELSSLRSRTSDDAAAEPLAPSPPEARAILLKGAAGPNGVLSHERRPDRDLERYSREQPATSGC